MSLSLFYKPIR